MEQLLLYPPIGEKHTEAQNGKANYTKSHSWEAEELGLKPTL